MAKYDTEFVGVVDFAAMLRDNAANAGQKLGPQGGMVSVGGTVLSPGVLPKPQQGRTFGWVSDGAGGYVRASSPEGQRLQRQSKGKSLLEMVNKALQGLGQ